MQARFTESLIRRASRLQKRIVFPDSTDERTLRAALTIFRQRIAVPILVGRNAEIRKTADLYQIPVEDMDIVDPIDSPDLGGFVEEFFQSRKSRGLSRSAAGEKMVDPLFYAAMMVGRNLADVSVAGSLSTTADVLRAGIQVVGLSKQDGIVSSFFLMIFPTAVYSFADCGVVPDPTPEELAEIAVATAENHMLLTGEEPRVALLSFATKGSAEHASVGKVRLAAEIAKKNRPDILLDGELQLDAAIRPEIGERKAPGSPIAGKANVLIFPDLNAGNIGYKIAQHMGGATALGPLVQGLRKPVLDLSRGCSAEDITLVAAIGAILSSRNEGS